MARQISRFGGWFSALVVIAALAFGASTAFASMPPCGEEFWEIGTCPPFDSESCDAECGVRFNGAPSVCEFGCCYCLL